MNSRTRLAVSLSAIAAFCFLVSGQASAEAAARDGISALSESGVGDFAVEAEFRPSWAACLRQHPALRLEEECTATEIDYQNAELDKEHRALRGRLRGAARRTSAAEQAHWSKALNDKCLALSRRQGSLNSVRAQDCFLDGAARRRIVLERQYAPARQKQ